MPPNIKITYPTEETRIAVGTIWTATVVTVTRFALEGKVMETDDKGKLMNKTRRSDGKYFWVMKFPRIAREGFYTLRIEPCKAGPTPRAVVFEVRGGYADLTITSHQTGNDIRGQLEGFVAFGTLGDESIEYARMTKSTGGDFNAGVNEDWESDSWNAMFPTLDGPAAGLTYTLRVKPYNGAEKTVPNLIAGP